MYHNPVKVIETNNWREECRKIQEKLRIHNPLIITSNSNLKRQKLSTVFNSNSILSNVKPNPTFESCRTAIEYFNTSKYDGVIAIGGGSVMDMAKVILASIGTGIIDITRLLEVVIQFANRVPSIFIPTTHGTGSEVTMWGTVWDIKEKKKFSISHPDLYPSVAILDGNLTLTLPLDISITSTMDALSHSFEAIWNKQANSRSTDYAIEAICLILANIERLRDEHSNVALRNILLKASNIAGLAFSNTKTAAAHSISYPLTIKYGIPHGVACSLPLTPLLQINKDAIEKELNLIIKKLGMSSFSEINEYIKRVSGDMLKFTLRDWGVKRSDFGNLIENSFTNNRINNNIVDLTKYHVELILNKIY